MTQPNQSDLNMNQIEAIISDHNKEMRKDMAAEITGGTRSASITNVVTAKAIQAHTNAEIAKVLDRAKQRFHEPIEHDGSYISISVIDKTFDELIQAERARLKEVK